MNPVDNPYPPIGDYAFISDCHCTALVSRNGSIDWCCMPRIDADSCFSRILDWNLGGYCAIAPVEKNYESVRAYLPGTMILETRFQSSGAEIRLLDFFAMETAAGEPSRYDLVRIVEGVSGEMTLRLEINPRFDFGEIIPRTTKNADDTYSIIGSNKGLLVHSDLALDVVNHRDLAVSLQMRPGERYRLSIRFKLPELIDQAAEQETFSPSDIDACLEHTCAWWQTWSRRMQPPHETDSNTLRSALVLKALTFEDTGAIAAAPTTSLPEAIGEGRNWDYRFSWVRDSVFAIRALHELGYNKEADRFLQFIQRSAAGSAEQLQIMYGVDGKRRLTEITLDWLDGYRHSQPVRIGNFAARQNQLDIYGEILEAARIWHASRRPITGDYWHFLTDVVESACEKWQDKDCGIWEFRGGPRHHVHSKAMCWSALEHGIQLAQDNRFAAQLERWTQTRDRIRHAIEHDGYDAQRGVFVQAFDSDVLDAALLLLPRIGFVAYDDARMVRTTDAICSELAEDGLLRRYRAPDGLPGREGAFLPCTFWLVSCLAYQGRSQLAWQYYRRALACANDVGLFSEEFDTRHHQMLGNFPQGLTHVSQIMARLALAKAG